MKLNGKNIFILLIILVFIILFSVSRKDKYTGFYYPDKDNLFSDIQSDTNFSSLEECRAWVNDQIFQYNKDNKNYDYECGKNCKLDSGKPYICEETLE